MLSFISFTTPRVKTGYKTFGKAAGASCKEGGGRGAGGGMLHLGSHADLLANSEHARQNSVREIISARVSRASVAKSKELEYDLAWPAKSHRKIEGEAKSDARAAPATNAVPQTPANKGLVGMSAAAECKLAKGDLENASTSPDESTAKARANEPQIGTTTTPGWWAISVKVVRAYGLAKAHDGLFSKSDPYVQVLLDGKCIFLTGVVTRNLNPVWNHQYDFDLSTSQINSASIPPERILYGRSLEFRVYDEDIRLRKSAAPTFLGRVKFDGVDLLNLCEKGRRGGNVKRTLEADSNFSLSGSPIKNPVKVKSMDDIVQHNSKEGELIARSKSNTSLAEREASLIRLVKPKGKLEVHACLRFMSGVSKEFHTTRHMLQNDARAKSWPREDCEEEYLNSAKGLTLESLSGKVGIDLAAGVGESKLKSPLMTLQGQQTSDNSSRLRDRFRKMVANTRSPRTPKMALVARLEMRDADRKRVIDEIERENQVLQMELRLLLRVGISVLLLWHFSSWWYWETDSLSLTEWIKGHFSNLITFVFSILLLYLARQALYSFRFEEISTTRERKLMQVENAHSETKRLWNRVNSSTKKVQKTSKMNNASSNVKKRPSLDSSLQTMSKSHNSTSKSSKLTRHSLTIVQQRAVIRDSVLDAASLNSSTVEAQAQEVEQKSKNAIANACSTHGELLKDAYKENKMSYDSKFLKNWRGGDLGDSYLVLSTNETEALDNLIDRIKHLSKFYPYLDRLTALRYLRARDGNVDEAEKMFRKMVAWYDINNIANISVDPLPRVSRKGSKYEALPFYPGGIAGRDRDGDPVLWGRQGLVDTQTLLRRYNIKELQLEAVRRYESVLRIHRDDAAEVGEFLEGGPKRAHFQVTAILDVKGLGFKHMDPYGFKCLKQVQDLARDYYPELLKRALIVRPPRIFSMVWAAIKWFIDPKTRDKIVIASGTDEEILSIIEEHIEKKYIPDYLGGSMITRPLKEEFSARIQEEKKSPRKTILTSQNEDKNSQALSGEEKSNDIEIYEDSWVEGWQEDEAGNKVVFRATISEGGIVPSKLHRHTKYKRQMTPGEETLMPGNYMLSKYY